MLLQRTFQETEMKIAGWKILAITGLWGLLAILGFHSSLCSPCTDLSPTKSLSNGVFKIRINSQAGTYDLIDVKSSEILLKSAEISAATAPYRELKDVKEGDSEAAGPVQNYHSRAGKNRVTADTHSGIFGAGKALTLFSTFTHKAEIAVQFVLYPDLPFLDIGWTFHNLDREPIRLRRVSVLNTDQVFPEQNPGPIKMLNGDSGGRMNRVFENESVKAENNLLFYLNSGTRPRSLVLGGLKYVDYRKFIKSEPQSGQGADLYAFDPVGRRVDPGQTYTSLDRFYIEGSTPNPFEALESYAKALQKAQDIHINAYTFPSVCMWFLAVTHFGGDSGSVNDSPGSVQEMNRIVQSGFLKYSPMAVRLVPDCYEQNNQQGWWDDEHWNLHGRKERCVVEAGHIKTPYETTEKWGKAIIERGGIPSMYFQPGVRSEDYAEAFPGHMLFDEAHRHILDSEGQRQKEQHAIRGRIYGALLQESYDYTDPDFIRHLNTVYACLKKGGVKGVFFDYPSRTFPERGGMQDRFSSALSAYRNVFRIAREGLGPVCYLQERLGIGSDATLGLVDSVRTAGDTNVMRPEEIRKAALRWYKNRRLVNYDMDGKALLRYGPKQQFEITRKQRRFILTVSYTVTGRLLLTESLRLFPEEALNDLSRVFPFHNTPLSARPLDVFISEFPTVFDFPISPDWHQLVLINQAQGKRDFSIPIAGETAACTLGLEPGENYYLYDFWNDRLVGLVSGEAAVKQTVEPGEALMLSVHAQQTHPQWISTNRHLMQGYVDLIEKPRWQVSTRTLQAISDVVENEPYRVTLALNGFIPLSAKATGVQATLTKRPGLSGLVDLVITSSEGGHIPWSVTFEKRPGQE